MRWLIFLAIHIQVPFLLGQDILFGPHNAATWILGNGQSAYDNGGLYVNPASIANANSPEIALTAANRYSQSSLFDGQLHYIQTSHLGHFGAAVRYFGDAAFNEQLASLAYARKLGEEIMLGIGTHYLRQQIDIYGDRNDLLLSLGIQATLVPDLQLGFTVHQTIGSRNNEFERQNNIWSSGLSYTFSNNAKILIAVLKESQQNVSAQVGVEFSILAEFIGRIGLDTQSETYGFGIGIPIQNFWLDIGTQLHTVLGFSPTLGMTHQFTKGL